MKNQLIFPMAFYVFYIWCLSFFMFRARVAAVKKGEVAAHYFKAYSGQPPAEKTILVGRHYDNQFQVPILFFVVCTLHVLVGKTNGITVSLAWLFVVSRLCHSWVHLGSNALEKRVATFAFGWLIIIFLWAQLVYFAA